MNHLLYGSLLGLAVVTPTPAADSYTIDPRHTFPVFEVSHYDFSLQRGRFNKTSGKVTLDNVTKSGTIEITLDVNSIDMGIDKWDEQMKSDAYFNAEQFPNINYRSDKVLFLGDKPVAAEGLLTILGVSKPVNLAITGFKCGSHPINKKPMCGANVSAQIKRSEFGMTRALPGIADDVKIMIAVEAFKD